MLGMDLKRWRAGAPALADYLTWGVMLDPSVILNKDGSFMSVARYRGQDWESTTEAEMMSLRARANNALRRLGSQWCLHFEARRTASVEYPDSEFPDPVTHAIDEERRRAFRADEAHYETEHFLTFTYLPPSDRTTSARKLLLEGEEDIGSGADYQGELSQFRRTVLATCDLLASSLLSIELLAGDDLVTFLHGAVSDRPRGKAMPDLPMDLDCLLTDTRLVGGLAPRLGNWHLAVIGVRSWPGSTTPAMLDRLHSLGIPYRWVTRWMPYSREKGLQKVGRMRTLWYGKRKSMKTLVGEALSKKESPELDAEAVARHEDAEAALGGLQDDLYTMGNFTLTVTTWGATAEEVATRARAITQVLDGLGLVSIHETVNAVDAWFGSLPGHVYADARRPLVTSLNLCDLMPLTSVWAGSATCDHLKAPALLTAAARGSTPFRLDLFDGDVGHTLVLGPTGAGKSVLLGTLAAQFLRYPGARVVFFDIGKSSRALTLAVGGEFHDLGGRSGLSFQPLRDVDQEAERVWARDWVVELVTLAGSKPDTAQVNAIWEALGRLGRLDKPAQRTMSIFRGLVQDPDLKDALQNYTLGGSFGMLLDADRDTLREADWQSFEMEELRQIPGAMVPVLLYLFHRLDRRFAEETVAGAPTLLVLDEAWAYLESSLFAEQIRGWLKTLRKRNVAVIFASQSLSDVASSAIAPALVESCPSAIYLPNPRALDPSTAEIYRRWGLTEAELRLIAEAQPKREYFFRSKRGNRLFDLKLGDFALELLGASGKAEQSLLDEAQAAGLSGEAFVEWFRTRRSGGAVPLDADPEERVTPTAEEETAAEGGRWSHAFSAGDASADSIYLEFR